MTDYKQYYEQSIIELEQYIQNSGEIPTEKEWNQMAVKKDLLSGPTLAYLSGEKFPELCKKIYKNIRRKKKGME